MTEKLAELPAVNWLVYVLTEKTDINGTDILLGKDQGASDFHNVVCSDEYTKRLILEMARLFKEKDDQLYRLHSEVKSIPWHPASELPDVIHSSHDCRTVFVTSPALHYVTYNGVCLGHYSRREEKWFIELNGRILPHAVTYWRHIPAAPELSPTYLCEKDEVEQLKMEAGLDHHG